MYPHILCRENSNAISRHGTCISSPSVVIVEPRCWGRRKRAACEAEGWGTVKMVGWANRLPHGGIGKADTQSSDAGRCGSTDIHLRRDLPDDTAAQQAMTIA